MVESSASKENDTPWKVLGESDRVDIYSQGLASNKFRYIPQCYSQRTIRIPPEN